MYIDKLAIAVNTDVILFTSFKCTNSRCGWIGDADENGSKMIALVGLSVNQPGGSELLSCDINSRATKSSFLINEPQVS